MGIVRHFIDRAAHFAALACISAPVTAPCRGIRWSLPIDQIQLPLGFRIEVLGEKRCPARAAMVLTPSGTLFVARIRRGKVYALPAARRRKAGNRIVASGLTMPVGVAFRDGSLYVSSTSRIRIGSMTSKRGWTTRLSQLSWRTASRRKRRTAGSSIAFGPDGYLYVPVGAPCNICAPDENRYANIMKMKPDGSDLQVVARGVRNSVGFDWHPATRELWFTDNGRDYLGDDQPDDELNRVTRGRPAFWLSVLPRRHHRGPRVRQAARLFSSCRLSPGAGRTRRRAGDALHTGTQFPAEYRNNIFIAEHGSWNRSAKVGYRIMRVVLDAEGKAVRQEVFAQGWLQRGAPWGRRRSMAAAVVAPDGSLLISDEPEPMRSHRARYAP
ncbi:PQQ-dependent sugar dehydrogenase [Cupriavidus basilensis]